MVKRKKLTKRQLLIRDRFLSGPDDVDGLVYDPTYLKKLKRNDDKSTTNRKKK